MISIVLADTNHATDYPSQHQQQSSEENNDEAAMVTVHG